MTRLVTGAHAPVNRNWEAAAQMLTRRGYDAREIEAILRWTRWLDDELLGGRP